MSKDANKNDDASNPAGDASFSIKLVLQQLSKEKESEKKEVNEEAVKSYCGKCGKEKTPIKHCKCQGLKSGGGGGGGGGSGSSNTKQVAERLDPSKADMVLKQRTSVESLDELTDSLGAGGANEAFDSDTAFDANIIADLMDSGCLLIESDQDKMTLTIKLISKPKSDLALRELKKLLAAVAEELHEFEEENHVSVHQEVSEYSLSITMPTQALHEAFIKQLSRHLDAIPNIEPRDTPMAFSTTPKPS